MPTPARYRALCQRSFARHRDLFLTTCFASGNLAQVTPEQYHLFHPTQQDWQQYVRSYQAKQLAENWGNGFTVQQLDEAIKDWEQVTDLEPYQQIHDEVHCLSLDEFLRLFTPPTGDLTCAYCFLTLAEFAQLHRAGQLLTKRLRTRGISFEADCQQPHLGYQSGNVVVCCYWYNNAKTDEFSAAEFAPVAKAFEQVWRARLAKG